MASNLEYPTEAVSIVDSLVRQLKLAAAIPILGERCAELLIEKDFAVPDLVARFATVGEERAIQRDAVPLLARYGLIFMVSSFEHHMKLLLLHRRIWERLAPTKRRMYPTELWELTKKVETASRHGLAALVLGGVIKSAPDQLRRKSRWLQTIYKVRNCLAHRNGEVALADVLPRGARLSDAAESDSLKAVWIKPVITVGDEEITEVPFKVGPGGVVSVRLDECEREWKVGENIVVSTAECQYIALSLSLLAADILSRLREELDPIFDGD